MLDNQAFLDKIQEKIRAQQKRRQKNRRIALTAFSFVCLASVLTITHTAEKWPFFTVITGIPNENVPLGADDLIPRDGATPTKIPNEISVLLPTDFGEEHLITSAEEAAQAGTSLSESFFDRAVLLTFEAKDCAKQETCTVELLPEPNILFVTITPAADVIVQDNTSFQIEIPKNKLRTTIVIQTK